MHTIDLSLTVVSLRNDGILHVHIKERAHITMSEALKTLKAMKVIGNGRKYPVLIDAGDFANIDPEVRVFSASEEGNLYTVADAIAYHTLPQKLTANFYVAYNKPVVPTRTFSEISEAVQWLRTFVKAKQKTE
jgi:hypothetical protein